MSQLPTGRSSSDSPPVRRAISMLIGAGLLWVGEPSAQACASCACGDPTLTVVGTEKPFAGRLRLSFGYQLRSEDAGVPAQDQLSTQEHRWDAGFAYAPWDGLFVSATAPLVHRRVTHPNLAKDETFTLGDIDLRARFYLLRDRRHQIAAMVGMELPTSWELKTTANDPLPLEAQAGTGSWDPQFGLSYGLFARPWGLYASLSGLFPTAGHAGATMGITGLASITGQYQPWTQLGFRFGLDGRWAAPTTFDGIEDPHSGGGILFVSPEVVVSLMQDVLLRVVMRWPLVNQLRGTQSEGPMIVAAVAFDV